MASQDVQARLRGFSRRTRERAVTPAPGRGGGRRLSYDSIVGLLGGPGSWRNTLFGLGCLALAALIVLWSNIPAQDLNLANVVFIYSIVATGIALLYHYGGLLSIAHGGIWGVGAYFAAILGMEHGWPMLAVLLVAAVGCGILATLLASISFRVEGSYFIIILFAVSEIIYGILINWTSLTNGAEGIVVTNQASLFGLSLNSNAHWFYATLVTLLLVLIVVQAVKTSRVGQRLKAIRDNRSLAVSVGLNVVQVHMVTFAITGAIAAIGGVYWAYFEGYVVPSQYSPIASIEFVVVVLLGGAAYLLGPTLGALVVIFLPSLLHLSPLLGQATIGAIFIAVILLSPQGIAGVFERGFHWAITRHATGTGVTESEAERADAAALAEVTNQDVTHR